MANKVDFIINLKVNGKDQAVQASVAVDELREAVEQSRGSLERSLQSINNWGFAFQGLRSAVNDITSSLNELTAESRSFSGAMAATNTMAGKSGEEFANLKEQVAELSKTVPVARDLLANGLYQVISNGVPENNWIEYLEKSAKASVGGIADLEEVVKVTSTVIKNYGLAWDEAGTIQDKIQLTAKNGVTSFEQMAQALPRVTANAATLGVSVDELMASFATLTGVSGNTAEVSTQLAAIFTALIKPSSEAATMAQQMGIQFDAAAIKAAGGMEQFLQQLDKSVKQYSASSGMLEQEVYGKLFGSAESLRAITPLVGNLADKFSENVDAMAGSAGTIEEAFSTMAATGSAKLQMLNNKLGEVSDMLQGMVGNVLPYLNFASQLTVTAASAMQLGTAFQAMGSATKIAAVAGNLWNATSVRMNALTATCSATMRGAAVSATTLKLAIQGLMIATGVGIAVAALTTAIGYLIGKSEEATDVTNTLSEAEDTFRSTAAQTQVAIDAEVNKLKGLIDSKKDTTKAVDDLNQKYGTVFGNHKTAAEWYDTLTKKSKLYAQQLGYEAQMKLLSTQLAEKEIQLQENYDKRKELWKNGGARQTTTRTVGTSSYGGTQSVTYQEDTKEYTALKSEARGLIPSIAELKNKINIAAGKMAGIASQMGTPGGNTPTTTTVGNTPKTTTTSSKTTPKATATTSDKADPLAGSIDWYTKAIDEKRKEMTAAANTETAKVLNNQLEGLQRSLYFLKVKVGVETPPGSDIMKMIEPFTDTVIESFEDMQERIKKNPIHVEADMAGLKKLQRRLEDFEKIDMLGGTNLKDFRSVKSALESVKSITDPTAKGFAAAGESATALGGCLQQLGADSEAAKAGLVLAAIGNIALSFAQVLTSCRTWVEWLAFGIAGTAQMISMVSTISGFATGGIVGGSQKNGDKVLVRVNSGEMILNAAQQARLFAIANGASLYGQTAAVANDFSTGAALQGIVVNTQGLQSIGTDAAQNQHKSVDLRLRGRDLVGSLANETRSNRKRSNIRIG